MIISLSMKAEANAHYPSRFPIGAEVLFHPNTWLLTPDNISAAFKARIDKVQFSGSKVTYDLAIQCNDGENRLYFYDAITVKDVDSTFVTTPEEVAYETARNARIDAETGARALRQIEKREEAKMRGEIIPPDWYYSDWPVPGRWIDPKAPPDPLEPAAPAMPEPLGEITEAPIAAEACRRYGFFCSCAILNGLPGRKNRIIMHIGNKP